MIPPVSGLPYTPQVSHHGAIRGLGHPQLLAWLQRQLTTQQDLPQEADMVIYKPRPNLVRTLHCPAGLSLPCRLLVVKRFGWRGKQHYLLSPLKRSKALREYRIACHLLAHGLHTPLPLAACEVRRRGFIQANAYVMEAMTDYLTLHRYRATLPEGPAGLQDVMQLVATYVQRLHDSGLWHRDLMLANFLLTGAPGARRLYLVDLNRARRLPYMPVWLRALDVARLDWHEGQEQFIALYGAGRHSIRYLQGIARFWACWRTWRRRVLNVINPFRRRLGLK